ncbi:MAG: hypothetical protein DRO05_02265 [Thermoproteota archaeon]|nr:MAG: hypothetical protein DRO05_02265 [Candidatus Korarchaeota archaeon]
MSFRRRELERSLAREEKRATAKVNIVGVGGCGNNIISNLYRMKLPSFVRLIAVNTDAAVLRNAQADEKILIGRFTHKGRGAQGVPELGRQAMEEDVEQVLDVLDEGLDLFIGVAGLGGGTGTGGLPVLLREVGLRYRETIKMAIVTLPLKEEGEERRRNAQFGLKEVLEAADMTVVNANDLVLQKIRGGDITYAFKVMDRRLGRAISAIVRMQDYSTGPGVINVDFSNFQRLAFRSGLGFIGVGMGNTILEAVEDALTDDFAQCDLTDAKGAIIYYEGRELALDISQMRSATDSLSRRYRIRTIFMGVRPSWELTNVRASIVASSVSSRYVSDFLAELGL